MVKSVKKEEFKKEIEMTTKKVLVDFWASWCGPCKMLSPVIEEVASKHEDKIEVLKVNVDEESELASQYSITSIPTLILFENGVVVNKSVGYRTVKQLEEFLKLKD